MMCRTSSGSRIRSLRGLRRRCAERVRDLPVPYPFDVRELCALIAARRGRAIQLLPMICGDSGVLGLWVATESADLILYEESTTPPHQDHIILHELAHVLCDHYSAKVSAEEQMRLLMPDLDPDMVRRVLGRTTYLAVEEQEAELLASLIRQEAERAAGPEPESNAVRRCGCTARPLRPGRSSG
jgi:hypothetical protein